MPDQTVHTETREVCEKELIETIEIGELTNGGHVLYLNGKELPFHFPEGFDLNLQTSTPNSLGTVTLELITDMNVDVRVLKVRTPAEVAASIERAVTEG